MFEGSKPLLGLPGSRRAAVTNARGKSGSLLPLSLLPAGHIELWFGQVGRKDPKSILPNPQIHHQSQSFSRPSNGRLWPDMLPHFAKCSNVKVKGSQKCIKLDGLLCKSEWVALNLVVQHHPQQDVLPLSHSSNKKKKVWNVCNGTVY